jgi:hypothetical protein
MDRSAESCRIGHFNKLRFRTSIEELESSFAQIFERKFDEIAVSKIHFNFSFTNWEEKILAVRAMMFWLGVKNRSSDFFESLIRAKHPGRDSVSSKVINMVRVCASRSSYPMKSCRFAQLGFRARRPC